VRGRRGSRVKGREATPEAPLRREGRPRTMRGATEGLVEVCLEGRGATEGLVGR
jgi:hypothetical protein